MHSRAGVSLGVIATVDAKVAHIALQPGGTKICIACLDGSLSMLQLTFLTVHSLYQDLYACRFVSCSPQLDSYIRVNNHACGSCNVNIWPHCKQPSRLCPSAACGCMRSACRAEGRSQGACRCRAGRE